MYKGHPWQMPEIHFFCDENITPQVQELLKQFGHKISSIKSIGKFGLTNGEIIKLITPMQEILVTNGTETINQTR